MWSDIERFKHYLNNFELSKSDHEYYCCSPCCADTNWCGYNRVHFRYDGCPTFNAEEINERIFWFESMIRSIEDNNVPYIQR